MLTKDLLRYKLVDGRIEPQFIKPTPMIKQIATDLLACYQTNIGQSRVTLDEQLPSILHRSRSIIIAKGLNRVVEQASCFDDVPSQAEWRLQALQTSARLLQQQPAAVAQAHRAAVAAELDYDRDELASRLYADLPDQAILQEVDLHLPNTIIERYNIGLVQGILLHANQVDVFLDGVASGPQRALLQAAKFRGLLVDIRQQSEGLHLRIAGPGSVLDQASRYGLQLAQLLPAIAALPAWRLNAAIAPPRREGKRPRQLSLDDRTGLKGHNHFLGHVPEEYQLLHQAIRDKCPDWQIEDQIRPWPLGDGRLLVPDLQLGIDGTNILVECFHRWHHHALAERLKDLKKQPDLPLVIAADRALKKRKDTAPLLDDRLFEQRGFLFSGMPGLRGLQAAVKRVAHVISE
jgi:predicted nuclease of restriction endonuclease-like RecB superfamily